MRIAGYGSGSGGPRSRRERREAFRRRHTVGQRVVAAFVGWQSDSLAWVDIDGQKLLAELGGNPQPGERLLFVIKQLEPDILLQVMQGGAGGGAPSLTDLAQAFWLARSPFTARFMPLAPALDKETDPKRRAQRFQELLRNDGKLAESFAAMQQGCSEINARLEAQGGGRLLLMPWLLPRARDLELLVSDMPGHEGAAFSELTCTFALPRMGNCELRVLYRPPKGRYRLLLEHPEHASCVEGRLSRLAGDVLGLELEPGGVGRLPAGSRTVLSSFLAQEAQRGLPRFSTHV